MVLEKGANAPQSLDSDKREGSCVLCNRENSKKSG